MPRTTLAFIGTDSVVPRPDNDTASFLINDHVLVDCGWNAAISMVRFGYTPLDLDYVFITHCHVDHYLGLAGVLFYVGIRAPQQELTVVGPAEDIQRVVELARAYLTQWDLLAVRTVEVAPGEQVSAGEFTVQTTGTRHPGAGLAYRFTDTRTGREIGLSGDTGYLPALAEHFCGVDLLVHEASYGGDDPPPAQEECHCGARQAAMIARDAEVGRLCLAHKAQTKPVAETLAVAREIFPETYWPDPGERIEL